jgi:hypothetical protein
MVLHPAVITDQHIHGAFRMLIDLRCLVPRTPQERDSRIGQEQFGAEKKLGVTSIALA